jgi:hypothetical protein
MAEEVTGSIAQLRENTLDEPVSETIVRAILFRCMFLLKDGDKVSAYCSSVMSDSSLRNSKLS